MVETKKVMEDETPLAKGPQGRDAGCFREWRRARTEELIHFDAVGLKQIQCKGLQSMLRDREAAAQSTRTQSANLVQKF
ncbi:hypothetical protein UY3_13743 [Chelonia mydas]|uniref:Uncharacterized protein n=1 Tax=Chelonia mydas TaxID=8469 RepID=M7BAI2_CHEMY|nr:hypothetical protein UY3_13743 [Chelonia mydas]